MNDSSLTSPNAWEKISQSKAWKDFLLAYDCHEDPKKFREYFACDINSVLRGQYDLRVPRIVVCVVASFEMFDGSFIIILQDDSASIEGMISGEDVAYCPNITAIGTVFVLQKVSIFVTRSSDGMTINRHLNITKHNITLAIPNPPTQRRTDDE